MTTKTYTEAELAILAAEKLESLRDVCDRCGGHSSPACRMCNGRYWTPTVDHDRITAAIRERGWVLRFDSDPHEPGDLVFIIDADTGYELGLVEINQELRGTHALLLALCRALGVV